MRKNTYPTGPAKGFAKAAGGFADGIRRDLGDRDAARNLLRFAAVFLVSFLIFIYVILPLTSGFWESMGAFHAGGAQAVLAAFGVESKVNADTITMDVMGGKVDFLISPLCSGDIETALLASLLIASFDVLLIWRLLGILIGVAFLTLMNPIRIALTLMVTKDSGMEAGDFYHSIIFRLFLFVLLVSYYFLWYRAFSGRDGGIQRSVQGRIQNMIRGTICKRLRI